MDTGYANQMMNQFAAKMMDLGRKPDTRDVLRHFVARERKTLKLLFDVLDRLDYFNNSWVSGWGNPIDFSNTDAIPDAVWKACDRPHLVSGDEWMQLAESLPDEVNPLLKQAMQRNGFAKLGLEKHCRKFGDGA